MRKQCYSILAIIILSTVVIKAQELMEVDGAITLKNSLSNTPVEGTIRWNAVSQDFEGYDGLDWKSLTCDSGNPISFSPMTEEQPYVTLPTDHDNYAGYAVAIEGDHAFVGAPGDFDDKGAVHVFKYIGDQWIENQTLVASNGVVGDGFGSSISISGDKAIIGAYYEDEFGNSNLGKVYFFHFDGIDWGEAQWMSSQVGIRTCVDIHGNTAIVGSPFTSKVNRPDLGAASIYQYNGSVWSELNFYFNETLADNEKFGNAVAITNEWAVVGAASYDGPATTNQGKINIYRKDGNIWQLYDEIVAPSAQQFENFGHSLSISGDTMAIGAVGATINGKLLAGAVYIYAHDGNSWSQIEKLTINAASVDLFGHSVALKGDQLLVGAIFREVNGNTDQGQVYNYVFNGSNWKMESQYTDPGNQTSGEYGWDVATDGIHRIVGMPKYSGHRGNGKVVIGPCAKL